VFGIPGKSFALGIEEKQDPIMIKVSVRDVNAILITIEKQGDGDSPVYRLFSRLLHVAVQAKQSFVLLDEELAEIVQRIAVVHARFMMRTGERG